MSKHVIDKAKYWAAIAYPENMESDWKEKIAQTLQIPFAYCVHDKDLLKDGDEDRKIHVHIMFMFPNVTTMRHALQVVNLLSADDLPCVSTVQAIIEPRKMYEYLIHNTDEAKKAGKYQYNPSERIEGNNFDIGMFEQISASEKKDIRRKLANIIYDNRFLNYFDFYMFVINNYDSVYEEVLVANSGHFERLIKGYWQKSIRSQLVE